MTTSTTTTVNQERVVSVQNGWVMLPVVLGTMLGCLALFIFSIVYGTNHYEEPLWSVFIPSLLVELLSIVCLFGFFTLQPNEARVLILFGHYVGTVRDSGFHWGNPFYSSGNERGSAMERIAQMQANVNAAKNGNQVQQTSKQSRCKVSLRARTLNVEKLKVNDKRGNPIEIAAVVVWRVRDTAQAMFDVDDCDHYVQMQSESALRHLASAYAYDHGEENETTLRSGFDEVSAALRKELQARLEKAGVSVDEARLTHLAYAPEIAQAMLRRQQAEAVIAARTKIVHGAVSMVDMALREFAQKQVVQLDDERKAAMVSNLMVVLCSESGVHPVVNAGTLYS